MPRKIGVLLFGLLSWFAAQATEMVMPPEPTESDSDVVQLSEPEDLRTVDPELFEFFQKELLRERHARAARTGQWIASAKGPAPTVGGVWVSGGQMKASYVPSNAKIQSIKYNWENSHLGSWGSKVSVRLYISNGYTTQYVDVTKKNSATISLTNVPASYFMYFSMKVGDLQAKLYNPPYIYNTSVTVSYTY